MLLTPSFEGRIHDKQIADTTGYTLPSGSTLYQDSGFQGFTRPGVNVIQVFSYFAQRVEHVISGDSSWHPFTCCGME